MSALNDSTLVITRPRGISPFVSQSLIRAGISYLSLPCLDIVPSLEVPPSPSDYDLIIFVSGNAAQYYFDACQRFYPRLSLTSFPHLACVGPGTAKAIMSHRFYQTSMCLIYPDHTDSQLDSESLWPLLKDRGFNRVLLVRAQAGRDWLASQIQSHGMALTMWRAYVRTPRQWSSSDLSHVSEVLSRPKRSVWWLTSSEIVRACLSNLDSLELKQQWFEQQFWLAHPSIVDVLTGHYDRFRSTIMTLPPSLDYDICLPTEDALLTKLELPYDFDR